MKGSGIAVSESAVAEAVVSARGMFGKLVAVKAKPAKPVVLVLPVAALKTSIRGGCMGAFSVPLSR